MGLLSLLAVSFAPGLIWLWYFQRYDHEEREPLGMLVRTFFWGMVMVGPAILFEAPFRDLLSGEADTAQTLAVSFLVIGLGEEGAKLLALFLGAYSSVELDQVLDGIIYGITAALGFAAVENFVYVYRFGPEVALTRGIIAFLAHASFTGIMGYHLGRAKLIAGRPSREILRGLGWAVLLHGLYDFILLEKVASPAAAVALVVAAYALLLARIRSAQALD
ncbi:MAG: PrsW family intramembrane metalloprotease [Limnochordia bacterium]|jgi:RsiW-degrading membrane proteinase PrsW (M82 family)|nr:PrsW family intramembrane metalloprotease [Bacillota bacterium]